MLKMKYSLVALTTISLFAQLSFAENTFLRIRAVGDSMLGNAPNNAIPQGNYLKNVLQELKDADITFGNMEGTFCDEDLKSHKCKDNKDPMCFAFRSPTHLVSSFQEAGFDVLNIANNHIFDYGHGCATTTKKTIQDAGIVAIGLLDKPGADLADLVGSVDFKGKKIGFIGFHYSNAWGRVVSVNETEKVRSVIRKHRPQFDILVVSMHVGAEGTQMSRVLQGTELHKGENRGDSRKFAKLAIDEGADLIIGHGPHVLRGLEVYKNKLIIYSLGNFATYTKFSMASPMDLGAIVEVGLSEDGNFTSGQIIPTIQYYKKVSGSGRGPIQLELDAKARAISEIKKLSELDFQNYPIIENDGLMYPRQEVLP